MPVVLLSLLICYCPFCYLLFVRLHLLSSYKFYFSVYSLRGQVISLSCYCSIFVRSIIHMFLLFTTHILHFTCYHLPNVIFFYYTNLSVFISRLLRLHLFYVCYFDMLFLVTCFKIVFLY